MSTIRETGELTALAGQATEHVARLRALLGTSGPPDVGSLQQAVASTRTLRGNASLLGLDPFQAFLGRLFQLLEDVESGELSWSARAESALREVVEVESRYVAALEHGETTAEVAGLGRIETKLAAWRRGTASESPADASSPAVANEVEHAVQQIQHLRQVLESQALPIAVRDDGLATLERELGLLQSTLHRPRREAPSASEAAPDGLRNHCEGALHRLVEAAAREVLEEARERGLRLGLRVTGALDPVDEGLGASLLGVLSNLWSDCLEAQSVRGEAQIDTVLRTAEHRLVVEIRDDAPEDRSSRAALGDDDVLGCYPGLRRSRPLVEALHGLVDVEPPTLPGCRFRLSLPRSTDKTHAVLLRVGRHELAIAAQAIESVHDAVAVRAAWDVAGAFVEVEGSRVPVLHLAFLLGDVAYDELRREHVVIVGSCERRAALFASDARRTTVGRLMAEAQGLWAGTLEHGSGVVPMLHVGSVLGRCAPVDWELAPRRRTPAARLESHAPVAVLLLTSAGHEREQIERAFMGAEVTLTVAESVDDAWRALEAQSIDLMLCDLRVPDMHAQQVADRRRATSKHRDVPMVVLLTQPSEQAHLVVQQLGAADWVQAPFEREALLGAIRRQRLRVS